MGTESEHLCPNINGGSFKHVLYRKNNLGEVGGLFFKNSGDIMFMPVQTVKIWGLISGTYY